MKVVLDTGALIALDRNDRAVWSALRAARAGDAIVVPATVIAQAWRDGRRQARLVLALRGCAVASFDERARAVGELLGLAGTRDVVDAHVAIVAAHADAVYTSDPDDIAQLLRVLGASDVAIVEC